MKTFLRSPVFRGAKIIFSPQTETHRNASLTINSVEKGHIEQIAFLIRRKEHFTTNKTTLYNKENDALRLTKRHFIQTTL
jgi:hypothetical protein